MKKFVVVSIILLLIGGAVFGFSLWHYLDVEGLLTKATPDQAVVSIDAVEETQEEPAAEIADVSLDDEGIFSQNYDKAETYVNNMSKEQMVGQLIMGMCSDFSTAQSDITLYNLGGLFVQNENLDYLSQDEVKSEIAALKTKGATPAVIAAEEEGGAHTTVSDHDAFSEYNFDSPRNLYEAGGLTAVEETEDQKAQLLSSLGFNLNLAPVVDLPNSYDQIMYSRSLCGDANTTAAYAKYVTETFQNKGVSVCLKHFPGYGTIPDTTDAIVTDTRDASTIESVDYVPFKAGVEAGAHFIMVSNVVVQSLDASHTAALSPQLHRVLRANMGYTGLIITDQIDDEDYSAYADGNSTAVAAILAGNDMIIARDYAAAYQELLSAVNSGVIDESVLKQICTRIIAYKYTAGILV